MYDVLIKNAQVIDGTGAEPYAADVAIEKDRFAAIAPNIDCAKSKKTIDARGKYVIPGIIDIHSHADLSISRDNNDELLAPLLKQGITTFVGGNCGMGQAPLVGPRMDAVRLYVETFTARKFDNVPWKTMGQYFDYLEKNGMAMNAAIMAPHSILRLQVMGTDRRFATPEENKEMQKILAQAMEEGAAGFSTGLQYFPGMMSDTEEVANLVKVIKPYNGTHATHLRSYTDTLPMALKEAAYIGRKAEVNVQVSHIMWVPELGLIGPLARKTMRFLGDYAAKNGALPLPLDKQLGGIIAKVYKDYGVSHKNYSMDAMPTTAGFTHALAFFPPWVVDGKVEDVIYRLKDPASRKLIYRDITTGKNRWPHREGASYNLNYLKMLGFDSFTIMSVFTEKNRKYEGKKITEMAEDRGVHPFDALCDLLVEEDGHVLVFGTLTRVDDPHMEKSVEAAVIDPNVPISTDAILLGLGKPSELFYGCYPHFFEKYVVNEKKVTWGQAVRKTSGLAADVFHMPGRGYLKQGYFADAVILDPNTIGFKGNLLNPDVSPTGIERVFVNGKEMVNNGVMAKGRYGRVVSQNR